MVADDRFSKAPENLKQRIWRYLDFTKFVDFLVTNELYFTRVDHFDDKFEGSSPKRTAEEREEFLKKNVTNEVRQRLTKLAKDLPKYFAANCWHMNDHESAAMWAMYAKQGSGIAITSTYDSLVSVLTPSPLLVHVGVVNYVDYQKDLMVWKSLLGPFLTKRRSFEHEKELRAIIFEQEGYNYQVFPIDHGIRVKVDANLLVESVYLAPGTPEWCKDLTATLIEKFGLRSPLVESSLNEDPIF